MYTMEYYSAIKKNEIMSFAGKWMEPEIIMLSKIKHRVFSHVCNLRTGFHMSSTERTR
jgi:hypothetical protein